MIEYSFDSSHITRDETDILLKGVENKKRSMTTRASKFGCREAQVNQHSELIPKIEQSAAVF